MLPRRVLMAWFFLVGSGSLLHAHAGKVVSSFPAPGKFATGMTCSHEQLLMDAEISAMAKRIKGGINVGKETIAADLIKEIGPQGKTYLDTDHTMDWLYSDEYVKVPLAVRGGKGTWDAQGGKDTYRIANDKVKEYDSLQPKALPTEVQARFDEIIKSF